MTMDMIRLWEPFVVNCPFMANGNDECNWDPCLLDHIDPLLDHFSKAHSVIIKDPLRIIPFAQEYILELSMLNGSLDYKTDLEIRSNLIQGKLLQVCKTQQEERLQEFDRKCLFCKEEINNRLCYFQHLKNDHGFNTGHPDNLVYISKFLDTCQGLLDKNQCIYCKKEFPESSLLRKHMRKKKHFKINSDDDNFDRFYVINYKDTYKDKEDLGDDNQEDEEGYSDWEEECDRVTMCLFDDQVFSTSELAMQHMRKCHKFDLNALKKDNEWDFYDCVRLINYIRRKTSYLTCLNCDYKAESFSDLEKHFTQSMHDSDIPEKSLWNDSIYLFPTYESDPLLMHPDLMEFNM